MSDFTSGSDWTPERANEVARIHERFLDALEEIRGVYQRLIELTRDQSRVLQAGVTEELLLLAGDKEREMTRVESLGQRLRETRSVWDGIQSGIEPEQRAELRRRLEEVGQTLKDLVTLEEDENRCLLEKRDETVRELQRLEGVRKFRGAYVATRPPSSSPSLLDESQ